MNAFQIQDPDYEARVRKTFAGQLALATLGITLARIEPGSLELRMPYAEVTTPYGSRPEGSHSKLSTYRDGWRILKTIGRLYVSERPLAFFGICAAVLAGTAVLLAMPLLQEYLREGVVPRLPTAVLSASMMVSALLSLSSGLVLDNVTRGRHEMRRLAYLGLPGPRDGEGSPSS